MNNLIAKLTLFSILAAALPLSAAQEFPNIVVILADDLDNTMVMNDVAGVVAIRMNEWKYIEGKVLRPTPKGKKQGSLKKSNPQLYNLKQDPVEEKNLINEFPEIAERMQEALDKIRSQGSERLADIEGIELCLVNV